MATRTKSLRLFFSWQMNAMLTCSPSPPPFLATPGITCVPWQQWKPAFLNSLEEIGGGDLVPKRKKAMLNAVGLEGQRSYYNMAPTSMPLTPADIAKAGTAKKDVFEHAIAVLEKHFSTKTNELMERHRFRQRCQMPEEAFEA